MMMSAWAGETVIVPTINAVIPAKAGIQLDHGRCFHSKLDSHLRENDDVKVSCLISTISYDTKIKKPRVMLLTRGSFKQAEAY